MINYIKLAGNYLFKRIQPWLAMASIKVFEAMYTRPWTAMQYVVNREAQRQGRMLLVAWLKHHRFQYCAKCLGLGQLKKTIIVENEQVVYLCEECHKSGVACGAAKPALNLVKP